MSEKFPEITQEAVNPGFELKCLGCHAASTQRAFKICRLLKIKQVTILFWLLNNSSDLAPMLCLNLYAESTNVLDHFLERPRKLFELKLVSGMKD